MNKMNNNNKIETNPVYVNKMLGGWSGPAHLKLNN